MIWFGKKVIGNKLETQFWTLDLAPISSKKKFGISISIGPAEAADFVDKKFTRGPLIYIINLLLQLQFCSLAM